MGVIRSETVVDALIAAGIVRAEDRIARVVIDLQANHAAVIHVQRFGDERLLDVIGPMVGVQVIDPAVTET